MLLPILLVIGSGQFQENVKTGYVLTGCVLLLYGVPPLLLLEPGRYESYPMWPIIGVSCTSGFPDGAR